MPEAETALKSYRDWLGQDEVVPQATVDACRSLEEQKWLVRDRRARGFRYWCPCATGHYVWLPDNEDDPDIVQENLEMIAGRSCLQVEGGE